MLKSWEHLLKRTRIHLCRSKVFSDMQRYILNLKAFTVRSLGRHTSLSAGGNTAVKSMSRGSKGFTSLVTLTSKEILKKEDRVI